MDEDIRLIREAVAAAATFFQLPVREVRVQRLKNVDEAIYWWHLDSEAGQFASSVTLHPRREVALTRVQVARAMAETLYEKMEAVNGG